MTGVEAAYTVEKDIDKLGDLMIARIEEKRDALESDPRKRRD